MTPEAKVKKRVKEIFDDLCVFYLMPVTGGYGNSGAPDYIICIAGLFYGVECKANGGKPTLLQLKTHGDIRAAGGAVLVIDESNISELEKELVSYVKSKAHSEDVARWQEAIRNRKGSKGQSKLRVLRAE